MAERFYLDDLRKNLAEVSLLPYEYCQSWNGKFRRPEGMITSNYQEPLKTRLLWVYEGLTDYYSFVLAVRMGFGPRSGRGITGPNWPTGDTAPLDGLTRSGWRVTTTNEPNELRKATDEAAKSLNYPSSIGLLLSSEGKVIDVVPGSPADIAKIGPHMKVIAVNGRRFETQRLADGVKATSDGRTKLELIIENGDVFATHVLDYSGGSKHPHLARVEGKADLLAEIFKPRSGKESANGTGRDR